MTEDLWVLCFNVPTAAKTEQKKYFLFLFSRNRFGLCNTGRDKWSFLQVFVLKYISTTMITYSCFRLWCRIKGQAYSVKNIVVGLETRLPIKRCFVRQKPYFTDIKTCKKNFSCSFLELGHMELFFQKQATSLCSLSCTLSLY